MGDEHRDKQAREMIDYIVREVIRGPVTLNEDMRLVSSGLIDSFALVQILFMLEDVTNTRIPAGKVKPEDMDTVRLMLATAQQVGRPRK